MKRTEILDSARAALVRVRPELASIDISETTTLAEMGIDSIRMIEVGVHLEDLIGSEIDFDAWIDQEREKEEGDFLLGSLVSYLEADLER